MVSDLPLQITYRTASDTTVVEGWGPVFAVEAKRFVIVGDRSLKVTFGVARVIPRLSIASAYLGRLG